MAKKRRGSGEGSVYKRKDDRWAAEWTAQTLLNGPKRRTVYGKTHNEVIRKREKERAEEKGGIAFDAGRITVGEYLENWLEDSVENSVKVSTYESYRQLTQKHLIPALGRNKLKDLTPEKVRRFRRSKLAAGLSARTVQYLLFLLRKPLQQAVEDGLIPRNVAQGVRVSQAGKEEVVPLKPEQTKRLLNAAKDDRLEALYVVAATTGMREGELLALRWEDVDLEDRTVQISHTLVGSQAGRPILGTPKTPKSRRILKLSSLAVEALKRHRQAQEQKKSRMVPSWNSDNLVFCTTTGTPLNRHNLMSRSFKPLLKKAGLLESARFHDLRHTVATLLASKNLNPIVVQETMGHSHISVTLGLYGHAFPGLRDQAASAIEDALS